MGVGAGTAKLTIDEHRAVDVQLNAAFARGLKASGRVKHLAFISAVGADPTASATGSGAAGMARYRVKGEAEEAVKESDPAVLSIFPRPMIIGRQFCIQIEGKLQATVCPRLKGCSPRLNVITVGGVIVGERVPKQFVIKYNAHVGSLFHFSEDPVITLFRPHVAAWNETESFVWVIDEEPGGSA
jgi:hypothetical protein